MTKVHSPQKLLHLESYPDSPIACQAGYGKPDLTLKVLKGASSRALSVSKANDFTAMIKFSDVLGLFFYSPSSYEDVHQPFAALRVVSIPKVTCKDASPASLALLQAHYPGWIVLKFAQSDLEKFREDLCAALTDAELSSKLTESWPSNLVMTDQPGAGNISSDSGEVALQLDGLQLSEAPAHSVVSGLDISTVHRVLVLKPDGAVVATGSAVCIHSTLRILITAAHVLVCPKGKFSVLDELQGLKVLLAPQTGEMRSVPAWSLSATIVGHSPADEHDMALLKVDGAVVTEPCAGLCPKGPGLMSTTIRQFDVHPIVDEGLPLQAATVGSSGDLRGGERLVLYGWSKAGGDLLTRAESACTGFTQHGDKTTAIRATFMAEYGMSGGPVFEAESGKLVGILSCTQDNTDFPRPIELGMKLLDHIVNNELQHEL